MALAPFGHLHPGAEPHLQRAALVGGRAACREDDLAAQRAGVRRYLAILPLRQGALAAGARVILEAPGPLIGLLASLQGVWQVVGRGGPFAPFDYQCPLLSVPLVLKTRLETIPSEPKYLSAEPAKVAEWRRQLEEHGRSHGQLRSDDHESGERARSESNRPRIGLAWRGSRASKSLELFELLRFLPSEFQYVSLQKEPSAQDRDVLREHPAIMDAAPQLHDFSDTAALCECLDRVISVDTSVAHLSGALGKPTDLLLIYNPDWRWLLDRDDNPWYPTVRLYRQEKIADWTSPLERVGADLRRTRGDGVTRP
jgi:hypothetical protein